MWGGGEGTRAVQSLSAGHVLAAGIQFSWALVHKAVIGTRESCEEKGEDHRGYGFRRSDTYRSRRQGSKRRMPDTACLK